jgi:hypothetical protein
MSFMIFPLCSPVFPCGLCGYRFYFPITSFAIVANCMFDVPS